MISPANFRSHGFTMLEIIISLFILTLVLGMAAAATHTMFADEDIRKADRTLQLLAKTARQRAKLQGRAWEIVLQPRLWTLQPVNAASPADRPDGVDRKKETVQFEIAEPLRWKVRNWGGSTWETPGKASWIFTPNGLCSPNRFRIERGNSWMETSFNPLTANAQDTEFYLP